MATIQEEAERRYPSHEQPSADEERHNAGYQAFIAGAEWARREAAEVSRRMADNEADGYYGQACFEVAAAILAGAE